MRWDLIALVAIIAALFIWAIFYGGDDNDDDWGDTT